MTTPFAVRPPVASSEATGVLSAARHRTRLFTAAAGLLALACGHDGCSDTGLFVLRLPQSMAVIALVAVALVLAGIAIGTFGALYVLRTLDATTSRVHRATLARVFHASHELHRAVEDSLAHAYRRVDALRSQLARMQETTR